MSERASERVSEEGEGWDREIRGLTVAQGQNWKALKAIPHKVLKLRAPNCKIVNAGGPFKGDEGYNSILPNLIEDTYLLLFCCHSSLQLRNYVRVRLV